MNLSICSFMFPGFCPSANGDYMPSVAHSTPSRRTTWRFCKRRWAEDTHFFGPAHEPISCHARGGRISAPHYSSEKLIADCTCADERKFAREAMIGRKFVGELRKEFSGTLRLVLAFTRKREQNSSEGPQIMTVVRGALQFVHSTAAIAADAPQPKHRG